MPGLLCFHAHPDDEVIGTGGILARYTQLGEQVVVVTATDGSEGEIHNYEDPDSIKEHLSEVRAAEVRDALDLLGVKHHEFLGYRDSGMMGTEANDHQQAFWRANIFEAAERLVRLIRSYQPEVMTIYDPFGGYGHPDHIQVHRVGMAAFFGARDLGWFPLAEGEEYWEPRKLYWGAWSRGRMQSYARYFEGEDGDPEDRRWWENRGIPDHEVSATIDVSEFAHRKIEAVKAHRSQIPADWMMLRVPEEAREEVFGTELFQRVFSTVDSPLPESDLFAGLR